MTSHLKGRAVVVTKDKEFNEKTKLMPFEITFQTKVAESEFVYSVTNSGPQEVVIEVPGLSRTWDQLIKKTKNNTTKARQWREFEPKSFAWPTFPLFRLSAKEEQTSSYRTIARHYEEAATHIHVYALVEG